MVGDRYFTDVVYGNRLGMLSVRVAPFTTAGETRVVKLVRKLEDAFLNRWRRAGVRSKPHALVPAGLTAD